MILLVLPVRTTAPLSLAHSAGKSAVVGQAIAGAGEEQSVHMKWRRAVDILCWGSLRYHNMTSAGEEFAFSHVIHAEREPGGSEGGGPSAQKRLQLRSTFPWRRVSAVNPKVIESTGDVRDIEDHLHGIKTTNFADEAEVRGYEVDAALLKAQALAQ